ncbi:MAG: ATP cone domain-containing protein, partial [Methylocystis sp.]|nr:ATP cone domain-containing protein [Methylocystis sp.]
MTEAPCPIERIVKRDGNIVAYDRDRIATAIFKAAASVGGKDRRLAEELAKDVERRLVEVYGPHSMPTVEEIQDIVEEVLIKAGHVKTAKAYILYRHERAKLREGREARIEATDNIPYKKIYEVLRWNMDHGCETVDGLNEIIARGKFAELVRDCDERYEQEVAAGARRIIERLPEVRIVIIAGPSSSGKTTTTIKMSEALRAAGAELVAINIDHYFFDLEMHPKDEFGDYDYETPQALDLSLINQHLFALLEGKTIKTPHYDFKTGRRTLDVHEMRLEPNQLLLIDSLHGLYPDMTKGIPQEQMMRLYVEALLQMKGPNGQFIRWS